MLKTQEKISVLDVGSGPYARSLRSLKGKYGDRLDAVGIDIDNKFNELDGVKLIKGNVRKIDFPDNTFDIVNESYLMVHFPRIEDLAAALKESMRVLKKDGVFIFNSETPYSKAEVLKGILEKLGYSVDIESRNKSFYIYKRDYKDPGTGGIDLTPANMNLQTQNAGEEIKFHLNPAQLEQLQNAPGFTPVIINIQPMTSLRAFLGLTTDSFAKSPQ